MSTNRHLVGRRQFLIASSAALATAAVAPNLFAGETVAPKRLAVGFARFDDAAAVVAAASIPAGDGALIGRGARVSLSGVSGAPADPRARRAVELLVHYSYLDGAERRDAPFRAWACSRRTGCQGNPVSFTVPVDEMQKITLSVGVERGDRQPGTPLTLRAAAAGPSTIEGQGLPVTLSLRSEGGLKLVRGFYIIVPLFDRDAEPRWSAYHLERLGGRWALHDAGGDPAPFEHFVLRIDYAKS
ncbi:MAG: hypothetical protein AABO58_19205 [Acidobacteriota bacterium]